MSLGVRLAQLIHGLSSCGHTRSSSASQKIPKYCISLVARHVLPKDGTSYPPFPADYASKLLQIAVDLHGRAVRCSLNWEIVVPLIVVLTAETFALFGIWLKSTMGGLKISLSRSIFRVRFYLDVVWFHIVSLRGCR